MTRIAVIGGGISGLAAAYYLSRRHEVHVFERDTRVGGHTHTILANSSRGRVPVDTGFIVYNNRTYPRFSALLAELGVATQASDMSFAVTSTTDDFEYSSRGLAGFFAQPANLLRREHYALFREILRFNRVALDHLPTIDTNLTLATFLDRYAFTPLFRERYLYPMAAAVWSMPPAGIAHFPAATLLRFFDNHGMLGINTHPQWRTIQGGSHSYLGPLTRPYTKNIHTGVEVGAIRREPSGVCIAITGAGEQSFDEVVFACHGDQVLPLLSDATGAERAVLGRFRTSRNDVCLHTDARMLPRRKRAWASWNYRLSHAGHMSVTYHMNRLQRLAVAGRAVEEEFCVTLNAGTAPGEGIHGDQMLQRLVYEHPIYDQTALDAQSGWDLISGTRFRTHYCGAYWFNGFHEDGLRSAQRVAQALGVDLPHAATVEGEKLAAA